MIFEDKIQKQIEIMMTVMAIILTFNLLIDHYLINLILPMIKTMYLLITVFMIGYAITRFKINPKYDGFADIFARGLVFTTGYFFLFSLLKCINSYSIIVYLLSPLFLIILPLKNRKIFFTNDLKNIFSRDIYEYIIFLIPFIYALLPSTFYDSLVYHIGIPNFILQNNGFVFAPQFMFSNMFIYYEISLIPAVFLGDFVPRLFHFFIGMIFLLSVTDFASSYLNIKKRRIFITTVVFLPLSMFLLTTVKADLISAMFIFLGIKKYIDKNYKLSGVFWGFAIGIKVFSGLAFLIFFILIIIKNKKFEIIKHLKIGLLSFLTVIPLLIKNYIFIKNPFFPFLSNIFISEYWNIARYNLVRSEVGSGYKSFTSFLTSPYRFSFKIQGAGGMVGPVFLIFLPFLAFLKKNKNFFILTFALLLLFIAPFFGEAFRYIYVVFVLLSIFVALSYQLVNSKILKAIFIVLIFFNIIYSVFTLETIYSGKKLYFGNMSIDEYRLDYFPTYMAYATINNITNKNDRILVAGEARGFLLKRKYMISSAHDYSIFLKYLKNCKTKEEFWGKIKKDNFNYLVFNLSEFKRLQTYKRLDNRNTKKLFDFLKNTKPFRQEKNLYIYKL